MFAYMSEVQNSAELLADGFVSYLSSSIGAHVTSAASLHGLDSSSWPSGAYRLCPSAADIPDNAVSTTEIAGSKHVTITRRAHTSASKLLRYYRDVVRQKAMWQLALSAFPTRRMFTHHCAVALINSSNTRQQHERERTRIASQ